MTSVSLYITSAQAEMLRKLSKMSFKSQSALIREAIDLLLVTPAKP